ncbi:hypothetical protein Scep_012983 [Stephania cephalantha]|uniref:Pentatricopeptide repeat-containing protein n=1 Tax=Stephania cephalantha TaxID=152367 RepID=A0AAP0JI71_9MAGN
MASLSRLRLTTTTTAALRRQFSSILSPDSSAPLTSKQKSRLALSLLKHESNPERIVDICRAASLSPDLHLDRICFSLAISSLSRSKSFHAVRSLLDLLKSPHLRPLLSHSIVLFGQAGLLPDAIDTFRRCFDDLRVPRSPKSLNALLFACVLAKDYDQLNKIFLEFPKTYGICPNSDTYNTVIKAFCESGKASSVYSVVAEMERKGVEPNAATFGVWLAGFYKEEKYGDVGKVLELMGKRGMKPGIGTYNIRIQSLCKLGKTGEAKALFEGMTARGMKANSDTYYHLIYGYCKEGDLEEAKGLFNAMRKRGLSPSSDCYFTLAYYLCQGGDFDTALKVCKASIDKDWIPNFSTMKALVDGLVKSSKVEEARELVAKMKEKFTKNADMWKEIEEGLPQP